MKHFKKDGTPFKTISAAKAAATSKINAMQMFEATSVIHVVDNGYTFEILDDTLIDNIDDLDARIVEVNELNESELYKSEMLEEYLDIDSGFRIDTYVHIYGELGETRISEAVENMKKEGALWTIEYAKAEKERAEERTKEINKYNTKKVYKTEKAARMMMNRQIHHMDAADFKSEVYEGTDGYMFNITEIVRPPFVGTDEVVKLHKELVDAKEKLSITVYRLNEMIEVTESVYKELASYQYIYGVMDYDTQHDGYTAMRAARDEIRKNTVVEVMVDNDLPF